MSGYTCAGGVADKVACTGQASAPGSTACGAYAACAAGSYLVDSLSLTTFSATGTACVPCPPGQSNHLALKIFSWYCLFSVNKL